MKSANFLKKNFLYCTQKKWQIKPQWKVEIEDGHEAP